MAINYVKLLKNAYTPLQAYLAYKCKCIKFFKKYKSYFYYTTKKRIVKQKQNLLPFRQSF